MDNWKVWIESLKAKPFSALGVLILLALPVTLILVFRSQDTRTSAATPDKLEAEAGVLTSSGVSKQNDSGASEGSYVLFNNQSNSPTNTPTPLPTSSTGTYGPGIDMDSKNNQSIRDNRKYSIKFRASQNSQVTGFRLQWRTGPGGYSGTAGNYGIIRASLRTDDGNGRPSGNVIASVDINPNNFEGIGYDASFIRTSNFPSPPTLSSGNLYHLQLENVHSSPSTSYIAINSVFTYDVDTKVLGRYTPHFKNEDYGLVENLTGTWKDSPNNSPSMNIIYANGGHDGLAIQSLANSGSYPMPLVGGNNMVRERFTVQGENKTVTRLWARIARVSGSGNAILSLENGNGSVIEQGQAQGSGNIPLVTPGTTVQGTRLGTWVSYTLTQPRSLISGQIYNLRISAPSGTTYQHTCLLSQDSSALNGKHDMKSYAFNEGRGEKSSDGGSTWTHCYGSWYHNSTQTVMEISN